VTSDPDFKVTTFFCRTGLSASAELLVNKKFSWCWQPARRV